MKQPKTRSSHLCPYCCVRRGTTTDHIVPRCLYPKTLPNGIYIPTVKACLQCNGIKKLRDDTFLRDYLATCEELLFHEPAQSLIGEPARRAFSRNQSVYKRTLRNVHRRRLLSPAGLDLGSVVIGDVHIQSLQFALAKIIRGLYFKVRQDLLPANTFFESRFANPKDFTDMLAVPGTKWSCPPTYWEVFQFVVAFGPHETAESMWLMSFYDKVGFIVRTFLPKPDEQDNEKLGRVKPK